VPLRWPFTRCRRLNIAFSPPQLTGDPNTPSGWPTCLAVHGTGVVQQALAPDQVSVQPPQLHQHLQPPHPRLGLPVLLVRRRGRRLRRRAASMAFHFKDRAVTLELTPRAKYPCGCRRSAGTLVAQRVPLPGGSKGQSMHHAVTVISSSGHVGTCCCWALRRAACAASLPLQRHAASAGILCSDSRSTQPEAAARSVTSPQRHAAVMSACRYDGIRQTL
jgi:hypothetical protein